jgi:hypothetical protein
MCGQIFELFPIHCPLVGQFLTELNLDRSSRFIHAQLVVEGDLLKIFIQSLVLALTWFARPSLFIQTQRLPLIYAVVVSDKNVHVSNSTSLHFNLLDHFVPCLQFMNASTEPGWDYLWIGQVSSIHNLTSSLTTICSDLLHSSWLTPKLYLVSSVDGCVSNLISDNSQGLATGIILDYSSLVSMNLGFRYVYIDSLDFDVLKIRYISILFLSETLGPTHDTQMASGIFMFESRTQWPSSDLWTKAQNPDQFIVFCRARDTKTMPATMT